jgi:excisionase family DNA binding protein
MTEPVVDLEPVYSVQQVAAYLHVDQRTIYRYISRQQLQAIRLPGGGDYRIPRSALDAWQRTQAPSRRRERLSHAPLG